MHLMNTASSIDVNSDKIKAIFNAETLQIGKVSSCTQLLCMDGGLPWGDENSPVTLCTQA